MMSYYFVLCPLISRKLLKKTIKLTTIHLVIQIDKREEEDEEVNNYFLRVCEYFKRLCVLSVKVNLNRIVLAAAIISAHCRASRLLSRLVLFARVVVVDADDSHEGFLWHVNLTHSLHALLTFGLLLQQLLLSRDVTTVTFS